MTIDDVIDQVREYLDKNDWKYDYEVDGDRKTIRAGVSLNCKLQSVKLGVTFKEMGYTVYAMSPMSADEQTRPVVVEYITRANYGVRNGNFEMDYRDGEIRYKVYVPTKGLDTIPDEIIEESFLIPPTMFNRYGNGLAALMLGFSDPETEIKKAES